MRVGSPENLFKNRNRKKKAMTERFALTPIALSRLSAHLPSSLTQQQASRVIEAARVMANGVWEEGRMYAATERRILDEFKDARHIEEDKSDDK